MADEPTTPTQPQIDPAQHKAMIQDAVKAAIAEAIPAQPVHQPQPEPEKPSALRSVILESVGGDLASIRLQAAGAADYARFYTMHPDAKKHEAAVEKKFGELVAAGNPMDRESIFNWYRGANFDLFIKEAQEHQAAETQRAQSALTLGAGVSAPGTIVMKDPSTMTPEELDKALSGVNF